jgi:hypothetical protein
MGASEPSDDPRDRITRRAFLKFAGAIGIGIVTAPFIGSISKFMPSYYYNSSPFGGISQGQNQDPDNNNDNNNNNFIRTAQAATASNDKNGIRYVQPLSSYRLTYSNETWTYTKNFRSDGSMRCDFKDRIRKSVYVAGYFKVKGPMLKKLQQSLMEVHTHQAVLRIPMRILWL